MVRSILLSYPSGPSGPCDDPGFPPHPWAHARGFGVGLAWRLTSKGSAMTIRVLLGATTAMARSALQCALAECEDIDLVHPAASDAMTSDIHVVVLDEATLRDFPPTLRTIVEAPHIGVVAIGKDDRAHLYRVDRQGWRFTTGQHGLADAIRAVARAG